jgi:hypothetical protein
MLTPGRSFTFVVEADKLARIHKVVAHNNGEILDESPLGRDVKVRVQRVSGSREPRNQPDS